MDVKIARVEEVLPRYYLRVGEAGRVFGLARTKTSQIIQEMQHDDYYCQYVITLSPSAKIVRVDAMEKYIQERWGVRNESN